VKVGLGRGRRESGWAMQMSILCRSKKYAREFLAVRERLVVADGRLLDFSLDLPAAAVLCHGWRLRAGRPKSRSGYPHGWVANIALCVGSYEAGILTVEEDWS
jgi:hypothetical protein